MDKIVSKNVFKTEIKPKLKSAGKTVALCHGVFDLVHPGHIIHFEQASQMADILVVSVTAAKYVRKGPGRPYFNDDMRMKFLSAIECIDYVMLSEGYTVDDIIDAVEPNLYIKGSEYKAAEDDITGKISDEEKLVNAHGGKLVFTGGDVFSSTKLINNALSAIPDDVRAYVEGVKRHTTLDDVLNYADEIAKLRVLVIGDTIIDRYSYCIVNGVMSKDMGYEAELKRHEEYLGGAAAIARHISSFTGNLTFLTVIGKEAGIKSIINSNMQNIAKLELVESDERPTVIKQRYLAKNGKREEYRKYFAVNNIPEKPKYEDKVKNELSERLNKLVDDADVVFLCDFGHGMINKELMELVQDRAKFLVVNCQTNSANKGKNIITKYRRADVFSLDQVELGLAYPMNEDDDKDRLQMLREKLGGTAFLTRGSEGAFGLDKNNRFSDCPALSLTVKDTVGAGDAFFSVAGLFAAAGAPIDVCTMLGNVGGALGANIVGNKESVEKINVLKFANTLMNI